VVKFIVNVRLMEKSVKSHVGSVMVEKVITQYNTLGMVCKTKVNTHPIHPAMVAGAGGNSGYERELVGAGLELDKSKAREGAKPAIV
jgi:hypothetical protein